MKRLVIIPARSGSKRIKNKNIRNFLGKPIIIYPLQVLKKSNFFNKIHISTESKKIKKILKNYNFNIDFLRNKNLSNDKIGLESVIRYVVKQYKKMGEEYDEIWMVNATSVFLSIKDIKNSYKIFKKYRNFKNISLMGVSQYNVPPEWSLKLIKNNLLKPTNSKLIKKRSQDLNPKYYDASTIYIYNSKDIFRGFNNIKYVPYYLAKNRAVDIDDLLDWKIAEALYQYKKK